MRIIQNVIRPGIILRDLDNIREYYSLLRNQEYYVRFSRKDLIVGLKRAKKKDIYLVPKEINHIPHEVIVEFKEWSNHGGKCLKKNISSIIITNDDGFKLSPYRIDRKNGNAFFSIKKDKLSNIVLIYNEKGQIKIFKFSITENSEKTKILLHIRNIYINSEERYSDSKNPVKKEFEEAIIASIDRRKAEKVVTPFFVNNHRSRI